MNIDFIVKIVSSIGKKTYDKFFDEYILFDNSCEKNCIYVQEMNRIFKIENNIEINNPFFLSKIDLQNLKVKDAKVFLEKINEDFVIIKSCVRKEESVVEVRKIPAVYTFNAIVDAEVFSNSFIVDGVALKKALDKYKGSVEFYSGESLTFCMDDNVKIPLSPLCECSTLCFDSARAKVSGESLMQVLKSYSLDKKNCHIEMSFNENYLLIKNNNISCYLITAKDE